MAKEIILNKSGIRTIVDDDDFIKYGNIKWYYSPTGYAVHGEKNSKFKSFHKLHRIIMNAKDGEIIDHINGNKLDNRKSNLRITNQAGNMHNSKKRHGTFNNYKGAFYIKSRNVWQARCRINGADYYLGLYKSEIAAAYAFNKKAISLSKYVRINNLPFTKEYLEKLLKTDKVTQKEATYQCDYPNIYWHSWKNKWSLNIKINGKRHHKSFNTAEEANKYRLQLITLNGL